MNRLRLLCGVLILMGLLYASCSNSTPGEEVLQEATAGAEVTQDAGTHPESPGTKEQVREPRQELTPEKKSEPSPEGATPEPAVDAPPPESQAERTPEASKESTPEQPDSNSGCGSKCDHTADLAVLRAGVKKIAAPGVPGALVVFGHNAFPVAVGSQSNLKDPVAAAAKWGKGRVFIYAHGGYIGDNDLKYESTGQLFKNAIRWLAFGTQPQGPALKVGVVGNISLNYMKREGINATRLSSNWASQIKNYNVILLKAGSMNSPALRQAVQSYVESGGGLLMAETGWGWAQIYSKQDIVEDFAGNILLRKAGLAWTSDYITDGNPGYDNSTPPSPLLHAQKALTLLEQHAGGQAQPSIAELSQATHTVTRAVPYLHSSDTLILPRLEKLLQQYGAQIVPTAKKPISSKDGLKRVLLTLQLMQAKRLPADKVKKHPAADTFPGKVPTNARRVNKTIEVDTAAHDWHSTGLYAAPGEVITVELPSSAVKKGLWVRIGAHKDRLWGKDSWRRVPEITQTWPLTQTTTKVASAFGGLLYIVVPRNSKPEKVKVKLSNGVPAPLYVMGKTKVADWNQSIRLYPAPWAELANNKIVFTVPSSAIRSLSDPDKLMMHWDKVMDAAADLATTSRKRTRPERVVMDEQISAGYMHAGYPIMTHLDVRTKLPNTAYITANGGWGIYHEIGHNHQSRHWTFGGTVEVTVNLFTLYIFEFIHNNKRPRANIYGTQRESQIKSYIKNGTKFSEWKSKPFLALIMYMQLQEEFGWKTYQKVFTEYRTAAANTLPKTDAEKRDQWMVRFSKAVGKNLGPFFQAWGVPTSASARQSIAKLPQWMPKNFPPKP